MRVPTKYRPLAAEMIQAFNAAFDLWIAHGYETEQTRDDYRERISTAVAEHPEIIAYWRDFFVSAERRATEALAPRAPTTEVFGTVADLAAPTPRNE